MKNFRHVISLLAVALALGVGSRAALAQNPSGDGAGFAGGSIRPGTAFGDAGELVYSISNPDEFPFLLSKTGGGNWSFALRPAADVFIVPNVSVGGTITFTHNLGATTDVGLGARAGYNANLTSLVSVWIRGGIFFHHESNNNGPSSSETQLDISVPFLFHIVPHFFLGVGPFFSLPLQNSAPNSNKDPTFGLTAIVGGYF